ncbi:MAG: hypothetical protein H6625_02970 [Bdellovibrionaceae bacterium]|nr:hypothetical protein [Pseudobdellovibrionaceae bacterium]
MIKTLRLMQFNLENFFIYLDKEVPNNWSDISEDHWQTLTHSTVKLKPLEKLKRIASLIIEQSPDILLLNEVGGRESLNNFNNLFLSGSYNVELIEGNSNRGIDIGYLVKKSLNLHCLLITHKQRPLNFLYPHEQNTQKKTHYFSRDVAELRVFDKNNRNTPRIIILGVHLKSKLDTEGIDPDGRGRRQAEVKTLIEIFNEVKAETSNSIPIFLAGDFNGIANSQRQEPEFAPIYDSAELIDIMELVGSPVEKNFTQIIFNSLNNAVPVQIDYFFINKKFSKLVKGAYTLYYKDKGGIEIPPPINLEQRLQLPSDHFPVVCDLLLDDIK